MFDVVATGAFAFVVREVDLHDSTIYRPLRKQVSLRTLNISDGGTN